MIFKKDELLDIQIASIKLYEPGTRKVVMDFTETNCCIDFSCNPCIPNQKYGIDKNLIYKFSDDLTLELNNVEAHKDALNTIFGIDNSQVPDAYAIQYTKFVQARKHKKKRINKKWLKRYGYKQILCKGKGWELHTYTDGTFEFVK